VSAADIIRRAHASALCSEPVAGSSGQAFNNGVRVALQEVARLLAENAAEERTLRQLISEPQATLVVGRGA
jgi:hypothetical protein